VIGSVLVDTNVFTAPLRADRPLEAQCRRHTLGQRIAVAPQTVAEARYGALKGGWGTRRLNELCRLIARVRVTPVDDEVIEHVAQLRDARPIAVSAAVVRKEVSPECIARRARSRPARA
jgi:predicted nucleic acid-binding protein